MRLALGLVCIVACLTFIALVADHVNHSPSTLEQISQIRPGPVQEFLRLADRTLVVAVESIPLVPGSAYFGLAAGFVITLARAIYRDRVTHHATAV